MDAEIIDSVPSDYERIMKRVFNNNADSTLPSYIQVVSNNIAISYNQNNNAIDEKKRATY